MKLAIAQIDPVVGAFEENVKKIKEAYKRACTKQARVLVTPELSICGYPPHDLIDRVEMFERNEKALEDLVILTKGQSCALVVGHVGKNASDIGRAAQNVVTVIENAKRVFRQAKTLLPTYDVFDEARYFEPATDAELWKCDGQAVAFAICEDLWGGDSVLGRRLYGQDPMQKYREKGARLVISLSASPYEYGKQRHREELHSEVTKTLGCPLVYVNQVGATDEILFDGGSFAFDSKAKLIGRLPIFKSSFGVLDLDLSSGTGKFESPQIEAREDESPDEIEILSRGLVTGVREYFQRTGFKKAVIGLSGGIDSAVVSALTVKALGSENVLGVAMPSQYSSSHSLEDAEMLAKNLGIKLEVRPIKFMFSTASRELTEGRGQLAPVALENLQSRLRGMILMTLANNDGALVVTTGNKSELATGYCTLYGDMVGAIAPIGDVLKTDVYKLAEHINKTWGKLIPDRSISKPPSAELRPNQTDQDTLPPYDLLDKLLVDYIENGIPLSEIEKKYGALDWVRRILTKIEVNEYKRRQAAPALKISRKAFGIGRRIPIAKVWDQ